jgi:hypothetical protein
VLSFTSKRAVAQEPYCDPPPILTTSLENAALQIFALNAQLNPTTELRWPCRKVWDCVQQNRGAMKSGHPADKI